MSVSSGELNMTKSIFCAACQEETEHEVVLVKNNHGHEEAVATCSCGRAIKFPASLTSEELRAAIEAHKVSNTGQLPAGSDQIQPDHPALDAWAKA
jgi:hypothetical protein